ncbi:MAG: hypothetical protein J6T11_08480 [Bacteroidaceae bacterium]|nr:hypothetical protein [Bacteroidaceae bacterium]
MVKLADIILLMALLCGCTRYHEKVVLTGQDEFREGDLVLRCGNGAESRVVTEASNSIYSHIGILHYDTLQAQWMVIHAVPGEAERGEPEYLKCELLSEFYAADRAVRGAWMRVDCPDFMAAEAAWYALRKVEERVEFDNEYLLSDTTQIYCTELVWQAWLHQGVDLSEGHRHEVPDLFSKDGECIFPCDIETSSKIKYVQPFKTQQQ